jgi:hypothetical protein
VAKALSNAVREALSSVDGIDRIEIDVVSRNQFRWVLWRDGRRILSIPGNQSDIHGMIESSRVLVRSMMGLPPIETPADAAVSPGPARQSFPGK